METHSYKPTATRTMCTYVLVLYHCGCYGAITCHSSCAQIMAQIDRINDPEAWQGDGLGQLPFAMADECDPWWHNTLLVEKAAFCDGFWDHGCPSEQRADMWPTYEYN